MESHELFKKYTGLGEKYLKNVKELVLRMDGLAKKMETVSDLPSALKYEEVEKLQLDMTSCLAYFKTLVSNIECYREKGMFLEKFRKQSLAHHTLRLIEEDKITKALAELKVRQDPKYLADYDEIETVRTMLAAIWNTYELHVDITVPTMRQVVSSAFKSLEYQKSGV